MDIDDDSVVATYPEIKPKRGVTLLDESGKRIAPRRIWLKTLRQVRREMASVYRSMNDGTVPTSEGTRLIYALSLIGKAVEASELEQRLDRLEAGNGL